MSRLNVDQIYTRTGTGSPAIREMPAFFVYRGGTNQTHTTSTAAKVQLNTVEFDTNSCFDVTTNYRYTPQIAGYYVVYGQIYITGTGITQAQPLIYKNGVQVVAGPFLTATSSSGIASPITQIIVYMNGSTDYVELWGFSNGTSPVFSSAAKATYLSGFLVRPD